MILENLEFTPEETALIKKLSTPEKVQRWINKNIKYNDDWTVKSFRRVLKTKNAHCLEGALFAATVLMHHKFPPLIMCCEARDMDHILFVYRKKGMWGSIGQACHDELKGRDPVYPTIRELVLSYMPYYYNMYSTKQDKETDLTLRGYALIDLGIFDEDWITKKEDLKFIDSYLYDIPYRWIFPKDPENLFYLCDEDNVITQL